MSLASLAIEKTMEGQQTFCKFLSPNDSGETGGHQSGFLISKTAKNMLFTKEELEQHIAKKNIKIKWQNDFYTDGCFTWYESKNELRLTGFTRGFPFMGQEYTGALFVLVKNTENDYDAFILNFENEINEFFNAFGLTPTETNKLVELNKTDASLIEKYAIEQFISTLNIEFPSSDVMAAAARSIVYRTILNKTIAVSDPDKALLKWIEEEYKIFRELEEKRYGQQVAAGFSSVDQFVALANHVLNRRKSRAGKSLEHHLTAIFNANQVEYTAQAITEGNKKPDFIFPSQAVYHDFSFPTKYLTMLAAKTTCKDRWRQILNEANRLRDEKKYLCTLQQGISARQMEEMEAEGVILVVPKPYIHTYPKEYQKKIWTIKQFVSYVKHLQECNYKD